MSYRILTIAPTSFFADYGCHVRILEEIRVLQARGHRIRVVTYHNGDDLPGIDIRRTPDVPWIQREMVGSSRHKLYLDFMLVFRTFWEALRFRPHILHAHLHEGALIGALVGRLLRIPLVFDYQGSLTAEMVDHRFLNPNGPFFRPLRWLEGKINRWADVVIPSSYNAAELLKKEFGLPADRIHTVADCVNTERFAPPGPEARGELDALRARLGIPGDRKLVVYLGLLAPYQGTDVLLEAVREILGRGRRDVHVLIMGYPGVDSYRALARTLGVDGHVTFPGRIWYREAPRYLALGEVAVAPKMSATEGAGKILNYMAMALPVVAFDTPVSREMLGELGIYAELGNPRALADRLLEALDMDPERRRALGEALRARVEERHAWHWVGLELEAIYEELLAARREHRRPSLAGHPVLRAADLRRRPLSARGSP